MLHAQTAPDPAARDQIQACALRDQSLRPESLLFADDELLIPSPRADLVQPEGRYAGAIRRTIHDLADRRSRP